MPCKGSHRKHTPIVSGKQRRFFGAEYGRAKRGEVRETDITKADLRSHLKESKGKDLPEVRGIGARGPSSGATSEKRRVFTRALAGKRRKK